MTCLGKNVSVRIDNDRACTLCADVDAEYEQILISHRMTGTPPPGGASPRPIIGGSR